MSIDTCKVREDWNDICDFISEKGYAHKIIVETQFKPLCVCNVDEAEALLIVPRTGISDAVNYLISKSYNQTILRGINEYYGSVITRSVRLVDIDEIEDFDVYPGIDKDSKFLASMRSRNLYKGIMAYDHGPFIHGDSSPLDYCMKRISDDSSYKPIYIRGDVGIGKTHFLKALAMECLGTLPTKRVLYITMEAYLITLIDSIKNETHSGYINDLVRTNDLILIDYVEDIRGKERTKVELLRLLTEAEKASTQVIMTSTVDAKTMFSDIGFDATTWGKSLELVLPKRETLKKIAQVKLERMGMNYSTVPEDVIDTIIDTSSNIRELEAALHVYKFDKAFCDRPSKIDGNIINRDSILRIKQINPSSEELMKVIADCLNIKYKDMTVKNGCNHIYKEVCAYLLYECTTARIIEIGDLLGGYSYNDVSLMIHDMYQQMDYNDILYSIMKNIADKFG